MSAKNTCEPLFVRVPSELKRRLEKSASIRRASVSKELTRLLTERLRHSLPVAIEEHVKGLKESIYKIQLRNLEALVLDCAAKSVGPAGTQQLHILADMILEMRRNREQAGENTERLRMEREAEVRDIPPSEKKQQVSPFAQLFPDDDTNAARPRLNKQDLKRQREEVRRLNLESELNSRGAGARTKLAIALRCRPGYVSQMLSPRQKKGHRTIGEKVAPKIEAALGLKPGALAENDRGLSLEALERATDKLAQVLKGLEGNR